ncbi:hypothetical protein CRG98_048447 [Punica granatum]|uniref:N-acetyltransferase domain-containing protein n=1 Tax=Punica granatum TaxID=22663 RepID=A0A2I0HI39_PUNGR|nr:hypothetical protein CRG98_048447 [Punica granatum]
METAPASGWKGTHAGLICIRAGPYFAFYSQSDLLAGALLQNLNGCFSPLLPYGLQQVGMPVMAFHVFFPTSQTFSSVKITLFPTPMETIDPARITVRRFELSDADDFFSWASDDRVTRNLMWTPLTSREQLLAVMREVPVGVRDVLNQTITQRLIFLPF